MLLLSVFPATTFLSDNGKQCEMNTSLILYFILYSKEHPLTNFPNDKIAFPLSVWCFNTSKVKNFWGPLKSQVFNPFKKLINAHTKDFFIKTSALCNLTFANPAQSVLPQQARSRPRDQLQSMFLERTRFQCSCSSCPVCHTPQIQQRCFNLAPTNSCCPTHNLCFLEVKVLLCWSLRPLLWFKERNALSEF